MKKHSIIHKLIGGTIFIGIMFSLGYVALWLIAQLRNYCIDHPIFFIPLFIFTSICLLLMAKE